MIRYDEPYEPTVEQVKFDRKLYTQVISVAPEFINETKLSISQINSMADMINYRWTSTIWGIDKEAIAGVHPASIWQWIKKDYTPQWFNKRFPVVYTTVTLKLTEALNEKLSTSPNINTLFMTENRFV